MSTDGASFRDQLALAAVDNNLASDVLAAILSPVETRRSAIEVIERLAPVSPKAATLKEFLAQNPNPAEWFCKQFDYIDPSKVVAYIRPLGIVFYVEGYAYGQFVLNEGVRATDSMPLSYGVTLSLPRLPAEYNHLFVVVNEGDGQYGGRSAEQKQVTKRHEEIHQFVELHRFLKFGYCANQFIDCYELAKRLENISTDDMAGHRKLARDLAKGMLEISRSEVIAYYGTGEYLLGKGNLCANFWLAHFKAVRVYLQNQKAEPQKREEILRCYHKSFIAYREALKVIRANAKQVCHDEPGLRPQATLENMLNFSPQLESFEIPEAA